MVRAYCLYTQVYFSGFISIEAVKRYGKVAGSTPAGNTYSGKALKNSFLVEYPSLVKGVGLKIQCVCFAGSNPVSIKTER